MDGNDQSVDINGRYDPSTSSASASAFVSPSRSDFNWNGMSGLPIGQQQQGQQGQQQGQMILSTPNSNTSPQLSSFVNIPQNRRASVAQSEMSVVSNFSDINAQRGFVGGVMTDNQTGWGIGSGMELSNGMNGIGSGWISGSGMGPRLGTFQQQQQQQQQQSFGDPSFGGDSSFGLDDISEDQFAALVAGTGDFNPLSTSQYPIIPPPQPSDPSTTSQMQVNFDLSSNPNSASQVPFIFGQQMTYPTNGNLMPPKPSMLKRDASKSSSDHSDAEMNGVSLAQVAGGGGKKMGGFKPNSSGGSRRGSGMVDIKVEQMAGQNVDVTSKSE